MLLSLRLPYDKVFWQRLRRRADAVLEGETWKQETWLEQISEESLGAIFGEDFFEMFLFGRIFFQGIHDSIWIFLVNKA